MPEKPKIPLAVKYKIKKVYGGNMWLLDGYYFDNEQIEVIESNLSKAERTGAKAERERILDYLGGKLDGMTSGEFIQIPNMRDWLKAELEGRK